MHAIQQIRCINLMISLFISRSKIVIFIQYGIETYADMVDFNYTKSLFHIGLHVIKFRT